jgi:putative Mg2+ transporter-C (MgtC) family protein
VPELSSLESLARLALAAALGGAIGLERELRDHEAGLRTHMLVSLGAALFTLVSAYAWTGWTFSAASGVTLDPTRIAAQIVSGIGFLGAGAIIVRGISVKGLTTAASVWVVAAVGMAAGAGFYVQAAGTTAIALVSLYPLRLWSRRVFREARMPRGRLYVQVENGGRTKVLEEVERVCGKPLHVEVADGEVTVDVRTRSDASRLIAAVASLEGVRRVGWAP